MRHAILKPLITGLFDEVIFWLNKITGIRKNLSDGAVG